jgi:hypothetical protein
LARVREEYRWTKEYALDTGADQVGLSDEEREAAEKAASGESQEEEVQGTEPNADDAARLQKQIEDQRAAEQAAREEAVRIAEEEAAAAAAEAKRLEEEKAAAAAAAEKAKKEQEQADALMALLNAQDDAAASDAPANTRRRLQARELSMDFCFGEFSQGIFEQDCRDYAKAQAAEKKAAAEAAANAQKKAEEDAKAAADAAAAKENEIINAATKPIVIEGAVSVEDRINAAAEKLMGLKIAKADPKLIAAAQGELDFMQAKLDEAKAAEKEANPALAAKIAEMEEIRERQKEEASKLPTD